MTSTIPSIPLCVDLDGSLAKQDLMHIAIFNLMKRNFFTTLLLLSLLPIKGRPATKAQIAAKSTIDLTTISFNEQLIQFLRDEHATGREIILVTGNDEHIAQQIADHLGFFSDVFASDGVTNLTGKMKATKLISEFGLEGFDYIGNSKCDIPVWMAARKAYLVAKNPTFHTKLNMPKKIERVFNW